MRFHLEVLRCRQSAIEMFLPTLSPWPSWIYRLALWRRGYYPAGAQGRYCWCWWSRAGSAGTPASTVSAPAARRAFGVPESARGGP
ncbi:hypothetical protein MAPG_08244 [Magnaporthiopsis poae ATCC 64411]|uniref:Uncharacterized protein n=1 Tax=Magnaporthiopsis poae (strain ATCC 64411 / 73-15) TaxID=644358 RepID=A0A0C4E6U7_MAGP6|nr:hypothetical protein MAPG_08244 [Magnaporthiopsis poae ATCC 64411]